MNKRTVFLVPVLALAVFASLWLEEQCSRPIAVAPRSIISIRVAGGRFAANAAAGP